jgi:hypothetical protein
VSTTDLTSSRGFRAESGLKVKASSSDTPGSETELDKSEMLVGEVREAAKITAMANSRKRKSVWDEGDESESVCEGQLAACIRFELHVSLIFITSIVDVQS